MATENIFLFVPNLIGYGRVALMAASLFYMAEEPYIAMSLYWLSAFLDAFDGLAARALNQQSTLGAVLDMVSDRVTTVCLMMTCAVFFPALAAPLQLLVALDIFSHWMWMYSSMLKGKTSHKSIELSESPWLSWYYNKAVLFSLCSANELVFMALYLHHFSVGWPVSVLGYEMTTWDLIGIVSFPLFVIKHIVGLIQLLAAASNIAAYDVVIRQQDAKHE